jgi:alpha-mannosidase
MFTEERIGEILKQLSALRWPQNVPLTGWQMKKTDGERRPEPNDDGSGWQEVPPELVWGGNLDYYAFRLEVTVPPELSGQIVEFTLRTGREGEWDATNPQFSVWADDVLRQGFDVNHHVLRLSEKAEAGEQHTLFLSAYTGVNNCHLVFDTALQTVDEKTQALYYDLLVPWQTACLLDKDRTEYIRLLKTLEDAVNLLDLRKPGSDAYYDSAERAEALLREAFYTQPRKTEGKICCVGHTHIDVAWLWTLSVTRDKAVRSFSTVLELMRRYPEYIFMSSQPQLYAYVKQDAPEIFEQIKARVAEGRWEPEGAMYVEPDCNLASGEALVRQIVYGKRFFREEFGTDSVILWLPDVFGYSAALPQIMEKCGVHYFMTTKISWNEVNKLPYDTFYWKGIDGTKVLAHFIPTRDYCSTTRKFHTNNEHKTEYTTNYNGFLTPCQLKGGWQRYQQKELGDEVLCSYGYGDGGGGPTEDMLQTQRRTAFGIPGCPATKPGTARGFFERLEKSLREKRVPVWSGELYLEYHRGTYTSMARNKKFNRRSEFALTDLETAAVLASQLCGAEYPEALLRENWEILLRNQFHDILPGSAIREVYEDSRREYARLLGSSEDCLEQLTQKIADGVGGAVAFNLNGQSMSGLTLLKENPGLKNVQKTAEGFLAWAEDVPAKGYAVLRDAAPVCGTVEMTARRIETPYARILLNEQGQITSWHDRVSNRELLQPGRCGNVLMSYEDKPFLYDNWNLYDYYREKSWPVDNLVSAEITETGPLRWALALAWDYQDTRIEETIFVYAFSPRVDFRFAADWKEDQVFLKALFPLELNTTKAAFEIQYGSVERSTAVNTSWDQARFEVCWHKWMDLSEGGFGVSFLNDCKYGVSVEENVVGISLIKSGRYPNPDADREQHCAVYSVLPHQNSWRSAGTVCQAYALNNPLLVRTSSVRRGMLPKRYSALSCQSRNVMIEVVKKAESGAACAARLYEFENCRTETILLLPKKAKQIWLCNMLEQKQNLLAEHTDRCPIRFGPFEIVTVLIEYE